MSLLMHALRVNWPRVQPMTAPPEQPPAAMLRLFGDIDLATADDVVARGANLLTHRPPGVPLIVDLGR